MSRDIFENRVDFMKESLDFANAPFTLHSSPLTA